MGALTQHHMEGSDDDDPMVCEHVAVTVNVAMGEWRVCAWILYTTDLERNFVQSFSPSTRRVTSHRGRARAKQQQKSRRGGCNP